MDQTSSLVLMGSAGDKVMRADSEHWLHFLFSSEHLNCNSGIYPRSAQTSLGWQNLVFTLWVWNLLILISLYVGILPQGGLC